MGADHTFTLIAGEEMGRISCGGVPMAIAVQMSMATPALARYGSPELKERVPGAGHPGRGGDLHRRHRARRRQRRGRHPHPGRPRRRRVGDQRVQALHHQRHPGRLALPAGAHLGRAGLPGHVAHRRADGARGCRRLAQAREARACGRATRPSSPSPTCGSRWPTPSARSAAASSSRWCSSRPSGSSPSTSRSAPSSWRSSAPGTTCASARPSASRCWPTSTSSSSWPSSRPVTTCSSTTPATAADAVLRGEDATRFATIGKLLGSRLQREVADMAVQFHGGIGYMDEHWTSRYFRDTRLDSIGAGADEVMLRILARMDGYTSRVGLGRTGAARLLGVRCGGTPPAHPHSPSASAARTRRARSTRAGRPAPPASGRRGGATRTSRWGPGTTRRGRGWAR